MCIVDSAAGEGVPVKSDVTPSSCTMLGCAPMPAMMFASMRIASSTSLRAGAGHANVARTTARPSFFQKSRFPKDGKLMV